MLSLLPALILAAAPDLCAPESASNIARAEKAILAAPYKSGPKAPAWDRVKPPLRLDQVGRRFALGEPDLEVLRRNGFVVPARLWFPTYSWAFYELYRSQMPLYVSADAVLHAVFISNDGMIADLERARLAPLTADVLDRMRRALPGAANDYPPEVAADLELYLAVPSLLLGAKLERIPPGAEALVSKATAAAGMETVELFGRKRNVDFTAYTPRGHYAGDAELERYFRAASWLSRLELNLVSRSCKSSHPGDSVDTGETPREAVDALALADLAVRAGVAKDVDALDEAWMVLAGRREDVSIHELSALRAKARIGALTLPASADALRKAIGGGFKRTARIHYMPEGTTELPVISTFLGPRIVADTAALRLLLEPEVRDRHLVGVEDVAFLLGHDRSEAHLTGEIAKFPGLKEQLRKGRAMISAAPGGPDLYGAWLSAVRALSSQPKGQLPSFMASPAFADLRLDSAVGGYGQLRHNFVLIAAQSYDQGGCEIPDGYVDPVPELYARVMAYSEAALSGLRRIDPKDAAKARPALERLGRTMRVLKTIAEGELAGRALTRDEARFLSMVTEMTPGGTGGPPTYSGWYFDLFRSPEEALKGAAFIADYHTSGWEQKVSYAGVSGVRLGVFVVDTGGVARAVVGPVARAYGHVGKLEQRLDDAAGAALADSDRHDPWAASYTVAAPPEPSIEVRWEQSGGDEETEETVTVKQQGAPLEVTIELLDHNRVPLVHQTQRVDKEAAFKFKVAARSPRVENIHVQSGAFHAWLEGSWLGASARYGAFQEEKDKGE